MYELKPLRKRIKARMAKNADNPTWQLLRDRWAALVGHAKACIAGYIRGMAHSSHEADAWANIERIAANAETHEVIEVILAMYLLQEEQPYRFKSDEAFNGQLVRRVRGLAPCNAGEYYDHKSRKTKRVYRDARPKTVKIVAELLRETFGLAGLTVGRMERIDASKRLQDQEALYHALGTLK